jgi:molybdenum cofactor biosynthesis enzyme MoaA
VNLRILSMWVRFGLNLLKRRKVHLDSIKKKRSHYKIAPGDIIQVSNDFYVVHEVGAKKIKVND